PFTPVATPQRILHFAFMKGGGADSDRASLVALCRSKGMTVPPANARHARWQFDGGAMRWESHNEFSTYRWELPSSTAQPFDIPARDAATPLAGFEPPGPLIVAINLQLVPDAN